MVMLLHWHSRGSTKAITSAALTDHPNVVSSRHASLHWLVRPKDINLGENFGLEIPVQGMMHPIHAFPIYAEVAVGGRRISGRMVHTAQSPDCLGVQWVRSEVIESHSLSRSTGGVN